MIKVYSKPDENGYYGEFGGAFIPEMLYQNVKELKSAYLQIINDPEFQKEFHALLKDYVGRPTPLFLAERLSAQFNSEIYLSLNSHQTKIYCFYFLLSLYEFKSFLSKLFQRLG